MKQTRNRIIAAAAVLALSASLAACSDTGKGKDDPTTTIVNNDTASVTQAEYPEKDADGSQISVVKVTDAEGKDVTDAKGAAVTSPVVLDSNGKIVTDAKGSAVTPNLSKPGSTVTTSATSKANEDVTTTAKDDSSKPQGNVINGGNGPVIDLLSSDGNSTITASAGDEITVQIVSRENPGYTSVLSWLDIDTDLFEVVSAEAGDPQMTDYKKSPAKNNASYVLLNKSKQPDLYSRNENNTENFNTYVWLYFDGTLKKISDKMVISTTKLKIRDDVAPGEYTIGFDKIQDNEVKCNTVDDEKNILKLEPVYNDLKLTVK